MLVLGAGCLLRVAAAAPVPLLVAADAVPVLVRPPITAEAVRLPALAVRPAVSRTAVPRGDLRGWRQTYAQDFTAHSIPRGWGTYSGHPGGNGNGWWDRSHVRVIGGHLHLIGRWSGGRFVTGGLMLNKVPQTYGKYEVRFKVQKAPGVKYALLLWPDHGGWPATGEIDFAEDGGGNRARTTATLHYGGANRQVQHHLDADFTTFQTVGVEWSPGKLVYTLNGKHWATVVSSHVPTGPMNLALQLEAGSGSAFAPAPSAATPSRVDLDVDWVTAYRRA